MTAWVGLLLAFVLSLGLMLWGAEMLTDGLIRAAVALSIAPFVLGYVFGGVDVENLAVGIAAARQEIAAIALGTVIGSATFLLTFAVGVTALIAPLRARTPRRLIALTLASPVPFAVLAYDGVLSRADGAGLLLVALAMLGYVVRTARTHPLLAPRDRTVANALTKRPAWWTPVLLIASSAAIVAGAELFRWSATGLVAQLGSETSWFGMVLVAAAISFEEVPRMVAPARRGHAGVSIGNILGTVLFFLLFNVGVIALVRPLRLPEDVLGFYWPAMMVALLLVSAFLWRGRIGRAEGGLLLGLYGAYVAASIAGGYRLLDETLR